MAISSLFKVAILLSLFSDSLSFNIRPTGVPTFNLYPTAVPAGRAFKRQFLNTTAPAVPDPTSTATSSTSSTSDLPPIVIFTPPPNVVIVGNEGPITVGPQTETETGEFASTQTGIPGLTSNSVTQTNIGGHATILPIWFLSPGIGIIMIPGLGVIPGGIIPPPPGFPPLFIGGDGAPSAGGQPEGNKDPQTTSDESNSSSKECTTTTVSSCIQTCTPTTVAEVATVTCGDPSCNPISGCSVTATTSTTTLSPTSTCTSECNTCYSYKGDGENVPEDTGGVDEDLKRSIESRSIAGRISLSHLLSKRADKFKIFNPDDPNLKCELTANLIIPNYPKPNPLINKEAQGAQMWWVLQETTVPGTCPSLSLQKVTSAAVTAALIRPGAAPYALGGDWMANAPTCNVDHVYELTILKQFFSSRLTSTNCADFKAQFDVANTAALGMPIQVGDTRLQAIWRQLPSLHYPDFAGMDAKINSVKAHAFSGEFFNSNDPNNSLAYLQQLALAMQLTNTPDVANLFKNVNRRVYAAMLGMDAVINNCGTPTGTIIADWATSYQTWITQFLTDKSTAVNSKVSSYLANPTLLGPSARSSMSTGTDGTATAVDNSIGVAVTSFLNAFPTPAAFTFDQSALLDFPVSTLGLAKRDGAACPLPSTPAPGPTTAPVVNRPPGMIPDITFSIGMPALTELPISPPLCIACLVLNGESAFPPAASCPFGFGNMVKGNGQCYCCPLRVS